MIAGAFLDAKRNAIFIGGTGTDKTHLCIGVASAVICVRARGRFFNTAPFSPGHHPDSAAGAGSGRHEQTIGERLIADQAVLRALPELAPIEHSGWQKAPAGGGDRQALPARTLVRPQPYN